MTVAGRFGLGFLAEVSAKSAEKLFEALPVMVLLMARDIAWWD